jgi:hypothetical protein
MIIGGATPTTYQERTMRRISLLVGVMMLSGMATAAQRGAKPSEGCALLTAADVTAAVGGPAGDPHDTGNMGGQAIASCMWGPTPDHGMITYSIFRSAVGEQRAEGLAKLRQVKEGLKAKGWKEEQQAISHGSCSILTPPPSGETLPVMTGCLAEAKGMAISVGFMGRKPLPIENVKTLLDKVVARLP